MNKHIPKSTNIFESSKTTSTTSNNNNNNNNGDKSYFKLNKSDAHQIAGLYDLEQTIGQGHFAVVKQAKHKFSGEKVAIKVIDKTKLDKISRDHLFQEVRCMKLVQHPNVVRLYEVIDSDTKLYLILELGDGGDMYDYIMKHSNGLSEKKAKHYFRQIVRAIKYCHDLHVVHRDLKPENVVFFEQTGQVKLTDFGFSNIFEPGKKLFTSCGSLAYSAPEILLGDSYDAPAVDIWSLGVILYMLVTGRAPFHEANDSETLTKILDCKYFLPPYLSQECCDLISRMIIRNPESRIKLDHIIQHDWIVNKNGSLEDDSDEDDDDRLAIFDSGDDNNINSESSTFVMNDFKRKRSSFKNTKSEDDLLNMVPLIKREHLSKKDNDDIIESMVKGSIASTDEILKALDEDKYNYITATYYLLAERILKKEYLRKKKIRTKRTAGRSTKLKKDQLSSETASLDDPSKPNSSSSGAINKRKVPIVPSNQTGTTNSSSSITSKANFNNSMKMQRNVLLRQVEALEDEEEEYEENERQLQAKRKALDTKSDDRSKESTDNLISETEININPIQPTPLTNIIEDEDEEEEDDNQNELVTNTIHLNNNNNKNQLFPNNTSATTVISLSRRSSRTGVMPENAISSLTIPEEAETDLVSNHHGNNSLYFEKTNKSDNLVLNNFGKNISDDRTSNRNNSLSFDDNYIEENLNEFEYNSKHDNLNESDSETASNKQHNIGYRNSFDNPVLNKSNSQSIKSKNRSSKASQYVSRVSSSGADTSSDNSDSELKQQNLSTNNSIKQELLVIKDYDWNRSASSSSRSRNKIKLGGSNAGGNATNVVDYQQFSSTQSRLRPLSISSETTGREETNGHNPVARTKSLAESGTGIHNLHANLNGIQSPYKHSLSVSSSTSHDQLMNTSSVNVGKTLSVEHRMANMSQMSIASQLSKNNSIRYHNRSGGSDTPNHMQHQQQQQSATPTPRESIVFNRGDEKPFAKILQQHSQQNRSDSLSIASNNINSTNVSNVTMNETGDGLDHKKNMPNGDSYHNSQEKLNASSLLTEINNEIINLSRNINEPSSMSSTTFVNVSKTNVITPISNTTQSTMTLNSASAASVSQKVAPIVTINEKRLSPSKSLPSNETIIQSKIDTYDKNNIRQNNESYSKAISNLLDPNELAKSKNNSETEKTSRKNNTDQKIDEEKEIELTASNKHVSHSSTAELIQKPKEDRNTLNKENLDEFVKLLKIEKSKRQPDNQPMKSSKQNLDLDNGNSHSNNYVPNNKQTDQTEKSKILKDQPTKNNSNRDNKNEAAVQSSKTSHCPKCCTIL